MDANLCQVVLEGQRRPLGVVLLWLRLALAFASWKVLPTTVLYVVPSYLVYMRSEEMMMTGAFGEAYRAYQGAVPFLVPRLGRPRSASSVSALRGVAAQRVRGPGARLHGCSQIASL